MVAFPSQGLTTSTKLDTSYISFDSDKGVRSPRTPTYIPDFPLTGSVQPFDHAKFFTEPISDSDDTRLIPPPQHPMAWIWVCHLCHSRYALGVTRRCLVDGHYYCSGDSDKPSLRKKKKHRACSTEFDYAAWKEWGDWRHKILRAIHDERAARGCQLCDFPSQCRYAADAHPLGDAVAVIPAKGPVNEPQPKGEEVDITQSKRTANGSIDFDQILNSIFTEADEIQSAEQALEAKHNGGDKKKRGKSLHPSVEEETAREDQGLRELVARGLWSNFEDVDLEKSKID